MTYRIIGTGNTAWFMATKLSSAGHTCLGIYGRNNDNAAELANAVNANPYNITSPVADDADVCIIAISDYAIADVALQLKFDKTVLVHTAGAVDINAISGSAQHSGVIWPLYSIVKNNLPVERNIPTICEASTSHAKEIIHAVTASFTDITYDADSNNRKWLHLSAVMSNNFTNHLFAISEKLCAEHNLPFSLLLPIIQQSVSRLDSSTAFAQQTGPAKRGDNQTMDKQMQMLQDHPEWQKIYASLNASIAEMYQKPL